MELDDLSFSNNENNYTSDQLKGIWSLEPYARNSLQISTFISSFIPPTACPHLLPRA